MSCKKPALFILFVCAAMAFFTGCGQVQRQSSDGPIFTDPAVKIAELSSSSFVNTLFNEALALEPLLNQPGTHVTLGYWSVYGNRALLIALLNTVNSYSSNEVFRGIWDEGATTAAAAQYPSYIRMNREYWYERASAVHGVFTIEGVTYTNDPYPVTSVQADQIWGLYSKKYTDMASLIRQATGITPEARCFVTGARRVRIFFSYEYPELVTLEAQGDIKVFFPTTTEARWQNSSQWLEGTTNAPTPEP